MKVVIVGAGIGGTALALSLARLGVDYVLLEQAPAFTEVGAGIQLSPNGVRVLESLGLGEELAGFCTEPDYHKYSLWDTGETVSRTPLMPRVRQAYGYAYYHAHRADLIAAITRALDPLRLRLNTRVVAVGQDGSGAWAESESGERMAGDLLIGTDGIHSIVREQVFSPDPPHWLYSYDADAAALGTDDDWRALRPWS